MIDWLNGNSSAVQAIAALVDGRSLTEAEAAALHPCVTLSESKGLPETDSSPRSE